MQAREVTCPRCSSTYAQACREPDGRFRCFHMARIKAAELAAEAADGAEADFVLVDLTEDGRAYLASLRDRCASAERLQRVGDGLSPLVVDGDEVRS